MDCSYLYSQLNIRINAIKIFQIWTFLCKKVPYVYFYKKKGDYYNKTVHNILTKEMLMILPNFCNKKKELKEE